MRSRIVAILAWFAAALTLLVAILTPFVLIGAFSKAVAHAGLHIDPVYSGGTVARTLARASDRGSYRITVYNPVRPRALQRGEPFVQVTLFPVAALNPHLSEAIDLDGDGQPDVRIDLRIPPDLNPLPNPDPHARPGGSVVALNSKYRSFSTPANPDRWHSGSFSQLIVRTGDTIVVRIPLR